MGRGRDVAARFLGQWEGKLQTDAYSAYDKIGGPGLIHYGCWTHARRYWVDAVKANNEDADAVQMVLRMDALFTICAKRLEKGRFHWPAAEEGSCGVVMRSEELA